ncbi:helicase domino isoform X2 [Hetaerina americana]|uniref:helicase domino isoform X2 n=1 Tax=Hetaerina americana TaxID=62018 RepID=UPI003A7F3767
MSDPPTPAKQQTQQQPQAVSVAPVAAGQVRLQQVLTSGTQNVNVLTTAGQQFVITSQVNIQGLPQVIPSISSSNALQQSGVARILNITPPRVGVIGVPSVRTRGATGERRVPENPSLDNLQSSLVSGNDGASSEVDNSRTSPAGLSVTTKITGLEGVHTSQVGITKSNGGQSTSHINSPLVLRRPGSSPLLLRRPRPRVNPASAAALPGEQPPGVGAVPLETTPCSDQALVPVDSPSKKRARLEEQPPFSEDIAIKRRKVCDYKILNVKQNKGSYNEDVSELCFYESGGFLVDYPFWRKRPSPRLINYLKNNPLDSDEDIPTPEIKITSAGGTPVAVSTTLPSAVAQLSQQGQVPGRPAGGRHGMVFGSRATPSSCTTPPASSSTPSPLTLPSLAAGTTPSGGGLVTSANTTTTNTAALPLVSGGVSAVSEPVSSSGSATILTSATAPSPNSVNGASQPRVHGSSAFPHSSSLGDKRLISSAPKLSKVSHLVPMSRQHTRQHSISAVYDNTIGSQESIVEKAKQEAYVMQRISELQRDGLWSEKRLPKVQEPPRSKAHWDYLLEEMTWLAADFAQERKWKKAAAKRCSKMVQKYFQDKAIQLQNAEKTRKLQLKRVASVLSKGVKTFWSNVEKLVEYKQQMRLEEKRKKALDQHLSFIVDQTEKYSSWLAESMGKGGGGGSTAAPSIEGNTPSLNSSRISSPVRRGASGPSDDEFEPTQSSTDDEQTIAKEEEDMGTQGREEEIEMLKRESEIPLEDLLKDLPQDYLENRNSPINDVDMEEKDVAEMDDDSSPKGHGDEEFKASDKESSDDEETIQKEEDEEGNVDHQQELDDLKAENDMSIEELIKKYSTLPDEKPGEEQSGGSKNESSSEEDSEEEMEDEEGEEAEDEEDEEDEGSDMDEEDDVGDLESQEELEKQEIGLKSLLDDADSSVKKESPTNNEDAGKEISDVAAMAETFQPKGNTLSSTSVVTKIPFLLKHTLREYQHIGLDWLVTMNDRKLNGILADEMGLGKTIQTIALLAHLACEKVNWGPHLIIVPTSVMLNWEMEFKKWCPAFKILTYYGTQKERRLKRTGWTKPNAFHVCITSYKLVIQDHQSFRRKKWKYLILDEAQNIKNFKSQRWQLLLNFQTQRRLLLTGTPLQNNLMELWSLMHFLMPHVFQSHREFKEWFSNPVTGMIEGNNEYNDSIIKRLHKVLRPFLLRRLKTEVEKQLPKKYEHIILCRLSKRQRYLYDDFMSRAKTRETLATGNLLSVINVLMQLRKVCNHPNLFESRPTFSPFQMEGLTIHIPSLVYQALAYDPFKHIDLFSINLLLVQLELCLTAFVAHRMKKFQPPRRLIEEIDNLPDPPPRCPSGKIRINVRAPPPRPVDVSIVKEEPGVPVEAKVGTSPKVKPVAEVAKGVTLRVQGGSQIHGYSVQLVQHNGGVKAIPVNTAVSSNQQASTHQLQTPPGVQTSQLVKMKLEGGSQALTGVQQRITMPAGFAQLVQTPTGRHILLTSSPQMVQPLMQGTATVVSSPGLVGKDSQTVSASLARVGTTTVVTASGQRLTVLSKPTTGSQALNPTSVNLGKTISNVRPVMRVPPLINNSSQQESSDHVAVNPTSSSNHTPSHSPAVNPNKLSAVSTLAAALTHAASPTILSPGIMDFFSQTETKLVERRKRHELAVRSQSLFYLPDLEEKLQKERKEKLSRITRFNGRRCEAYPIYGADLVDAVKLMQLESKGKSVSRWKGEGYTHCQNALKEEDILLRKFPWGSSHALKNTLHTPGQLVEKLIPIFTRFVMCVPSAAAPMPKLHVSHPHPSHLWEEQRNEALLHHQLTSRCDILHPVASAMVTQFPDPRLIQYDCGKLQVLDRLLRQLKAGHHRALIFTQMTRMLDVLEAFLNYHGIVYLRLDGTTRVDQRQLLMERFNADKRIFVFILSTRSGGIGVNLTGADTVIFYDSDWNPTMDAQAQDRCHRIGQTRDVHIYRLVSEMTVEENILKKANQKRMLGDLAIEGGNFTTAYFKSTTIQDLFNVDVGENDASKRMAEVLERDALKEKKVQIDNKEDGSHVGKDEKLALGALESALAAAEDETDVQAARTAKAEAAADLAEFDESIPLEEGAAQIEQGEEMSKAEMEIQNIISQLTPLERYAMKYLEESDAWSAEQLAAAEAEIEQQKREWELGRLRALQEEEERRACSTDDEMITFSREDADNQVWVSQDSREQMPMWCPPTPPQDDGDVYIDTAMGFLYEHTIMSESQLPSVYVKREHKRARAESSHGSEREGRRPMKVRKEESIFSPRSLFDRPTPAIMKMRRDLRLQKFRGMHRSVAPVQMGLSMGGVKPSVVGKPGGNGSGVPSGVSVQDVVSEWSIHEDWALLQVVQTLLELPLNLMVLSPGHTPNWDMVSDMVNTVSCIYRSPKQCRNRFECVIVPREEGKILYEANPKRQKKTKGVYKMQYVPGSPGSPSLKSGGSSARPLRTAQLFAQDGNASLARLYARRFDNIRLLSGRRTPSVKPVLVNPTIRNPKHAAVLAEAGISYDNPLSPVEVATRRAERISREKLKSAQVQSQVPSADQLAAQRLQQQQGKGGVATGTALSTTTSVALQVSPTPGLALQAGSSTLSANVSQQQALVVSAGSSTGIQAGTAVATLSPATSAALRNSRPVTTLTVQEMMANQLRASQAVTVGGGAAGSVVVPQGGSTPVMSVANFSPAQVQAAAQRLVAGSPGAVTAVSSGPGKGVAAAAAVGKSLTPSQLQYLRQQSQTLVRNQRQSQQQQQAARTLQVGGPQQQQQGIGAGVAAGQQKVSVASVTAAGLVGTVGAGGLAAVHVSQAVAQQAQRVQYMKQQAAVAAAAAAGKGLPAGVGTVTGTMARTVVSETEVAALIKRQQQLQAQHQQKVAAAAAASGSGGAQVTNLTTTQILAQAGLQVKGTISSAGGVKGVTAGVSPSAQQQMRQLAFQQQLLHRKIPQQKVAQLAQVAGAKGVVPTQLIVQGQKQLSATVTVQQIQQVMKQVQQQQNVQGVQHISHVASGQTLGSQAIHSHAVLAAAAAKGQSAGVGGQLSPAVAATLHAGNQQSIQTRVIPMTTGQASLKQTIQVVAAGSPGTATLGPSLSLDASGRPQVSVACTATSLANALVASGAGTIKVSTPTTVTAAQQQAIISQVTAALQQSQQQPVSVAVRQSGSGTALRIQTATNSPTVSMVAQQQQQQSVAAQLSQQQQSSNAP